MKDFNHVSLVMLNCLDFLLPDNLEINSKIIVNGS